MAQASPIINSFVAGELSPRLAGRTDIQQYYQSAAEIRNMLVEFYGGAKKAPGTYFVNEVKDSSLSTRLFRFVFSDTQAYILEFGNLYIRFYKDDATTGKGGAILETGKDISGIVLSEGGNRSDILGTTGNVYVDKFNRALGVGGSPMPGPTTAFGPGTPMAAAQPMMQPMMQPADPFEDMGVLSRLAASRGIAQDAEAAPIMNLFNILTQKKDPRLAEAAKARGGFFGLLGG